MARQLAAEQEALIADQTSVDKHNPQGRPRGPSTICGYQERLVQTGTWVPRAEGGN